MAQDRLKNRPRAQALLLQFVRTRGMHDPQARFAGQRMILNGKGKRACALPAAGRNGNVSSYAAACVVGRGFDPTLASA
jgi:hypothetical protein